MVSFFKYRQCLITAPVVQSAYLRAWYTKYAFTRSVYQPLAYASLYQPLVSEAPTNQGEVH